MDRMPEPRNPRILQEGDSDGLAEGARDEVPDMGPVAAWEGVPEGTGGAKGVTGKPDTHHHCIIKLS